MPFIGRRAQGFGKHDIIGHLHADLAGLGGKQRAVGAYEIRQIEPLENLERLFANIVFADEQLDTAAGVLDVGENGFAHLPFGNQPTCDSHKAFLLVVCPGCSAGFAGGKLVGKRINTGLRQSGEVGAALFDELIRVFHGGQINTDCARKCNPLWLKLGPIPLKNRGCDLFPLLLRFVSV